MPAFSSKAKYKVFAVSVLQNTRELVSLQGAGTAKKYAQIYNARAAPLSLYTPQSPPHLLVNNKFERDILKGFFT